MCYSLTKNRKDVHYTMPFSDKLKQLRLERGLTQDELATLTGLKRSAIGMYESGNREPKFEILELLADFFNVDMNVLLGKDAVPQGYYINPETAALAQEIHDNPDLRILMDASRDLSPEDVKFVAEMVQRMKKKERGDID